MLGEGEAQQAQIAEWLTWASTELTPLMDDKLVKLNDHLATRSYLVGGCVTLADLVIYALVHPAVAGFPVAQTQHFCNLIRWYDLLQNTADAKGFFPRVPVTRPRYVPPPPPAPAAAPAAAAAAGGKGGAAPAAAAKGQAAGKAEAPVADGPVAAGKGKGAAAADGGKKGAAAAAAAAPAPAAAAAAPAAGDAPAAAEAGGKKEGGKKDKKEGKKEGGAAAPAAAAAAAPAGKKDEEIGIDALDCRVGKIVKVGPHPNADALYLEEIDVGEEKPRQVISGLRNFVPLEQMQDRVVVVVCNLKPAKMRDVMSYGMVLCASDDAHGKVEPVLVPEGVPLGERVMVEGFNGAPIDEIKPNKKILERLFPDMKTNEAGVPVFKGVPFTTSKGPLSSSVPNGWVK